jgi:hypothetical protein
MPSSYADDGTELRRLSIEVRWMGLVRVVSDVVALGGIVILAHSSLRQPSVR